MIIAGTPVEATTPPTGAMTPDIPGMAARGPRALSDPQLNALQELGRLRHRRGPDWYGGAGWGNTLQALERMGLAATRLGVDQRIIARATDAGMRELAKRGIPWR